MSNFIVDEVSKFTQEDWKKIKALVHSRSFNLNQHYGKFTSPIVYGFDRCGFFNCIAGMHHPTCRKYPGKHKELTLIEFKSEDERIEEMLAQADGEDW